MGLDDGLGVAADEGTPRLGGGRVLDLGRHVRLVLDRPDDRRQPIRKRRARAAFQPSSQFFFRLDLGANEADRRTENVFVFCPAQNRTRCTPCSGTATSQCWPRVPTTDPSK